jgi:hypothetical protein
MSIRIELSELAEAVAHQSPVAYLLTVRDDATVHVVAVTPSVGAVVECEPGNSAGKNAQARPKVTLVWPPASPDEKSLIVDGHATVKDGTLTVTPESAILHLRR